MIEAFFQRAIGPQSRKSRREASLQQPQLTDCEKLVLATLIFLAQDLCNQIRHWETYMSEIEKRGLEAGRFLNPLVAEWFSGRFGLIEGPFIFFAIQCVLFIAIIASCQDCRPIGLCPKLAKLPYQMLTACSHQMRPGQTVAKPYGNHLRAKC